MRKILMPAVLAGLLVSACGDDSTGGNGGGGDSPAGGGGTGGEGAQGLGGMGAGGMGAGGMGAGGMGAGGMGAGGEGGMINPVCGDGSVDTDEGCDDGDTTNGDGCDSMCEEEAGYDCTGEPSDCASNCGDGVIAVGSELCDDSDAMAGDGCSDSCQIENGWSCMDEPSVCMTGCGDGIIAGMEACDDMDMMGGDGCSAACAVELGFVCNGEPSMCALGGTCMAPIVVTGDGFVFASADPSLFGDDLLFTDVSCLDPSSAMGAKPDLVFSVALAAGETLQVAESGTIDGLLHVTQDCMNSSVCLESFDGVGMSEINPGLVFQATTAGTYTVVFDSWTFTAGDTLDLLFNISPCGDGTVGPGEGCDDMDVMGGDGCSATCTVEAGFECTGTMPSVCTQLCGNGQLDAGETCDDMDLMGGDGCSAVCATEMGFICTGEPSVCTAVPAASCMAPIVASDGFVFGGTGFGAFLDDLDFPDASCADVDTAMFNSPEAVFSIALTAGQRVRVRNNAAQPDLDTVIQALGTTCAGNQVCLGEFDDPEATGLSFLAPTAGTYFFAVESYFAVPTPGDNFSIQFDVATCGDGVIEFGEVCDQGGGNVTNGDGCSSTCTVEPGFMCTGTPSVCTGAPLANCASPIVVVGNNLTFAGTNINTFLDTENYNAGTGCVDVSTTPPSGFDVVFRADLTIGQTVRVRELGGLDAVMHILQAPQCGAGVPCAASADFNETVGLSFTAVANGPVFIVVESFGNPGAMTTYDVRIDIAQCGDGVIGGAETCDQGGGNVANGDGCSSACVVEAGFLCSGTPSVCVPAVPLEAITGCPANVCTFAVGNGPNGGDTFTYVIPGALHPVVNDLGNPDMAVCGSTAGVYGTGDELTINLPTTGYTQYTVNTCGGTTGDSSVAVHNSTTPAMATLIGCNGDANGGPSFCSKVGNPAVSGGIPVPDATSGATLFVVVDEFSASSFWNNTTTRTIVVEMIP